jgi:hypothetical protein
MGRSDRRAARGKKRMKRGWRGEGRGLCMKIHESTIAGSISSSSPKSINAST